MNMVNIEGKRLKTVIFNVNQRLYRANQGTFSVNRLASENYRNAPMKYFTLNERELSAYTKYGKPFKKTWRAIENLTLVDILHKPTREALAELIGSEDLDFSFPIRYDKVYRVSEEDKMYHDDNVLKAICKLGVDGYYMRAIEPNNNAKGFHSEVGICGSSLKKLRLERVQKNMYEPPQGPTRKRRRFNNNNNNTQRNNNNSKRARLNFTRRISPPSFMSFD